MSSAKKKNRLSDEKSPYLLQHQHNPVEWYSWSDEAFQAAENQEKPIFLSIGYSTCYWCHVMEQDSFESEEVAEILNKYFISIKIDREERPDIDKIYMDAVMAMSGHGGWPLSALLTPKLKPFFGGTFIPKAQFIELLGKVNKLWSEERTTIIESAEGITEAISSQAFPPPLPSLDTITNSDQALRKFYLQQKNSFDASYGGFGPAPKFPQATGLSLLLKFYARSKEPFALEMVNTTLDRMARGGIYDHLGYGFSRYSTDEKWLVPHFEKMIYDNALLVKTYLEAARLDDNEMFRQVAKETLSYLLRDMLDEQGGFYAAEDAGDVGREGEYYVWEESEIESVLSAEEFSKIKDIYGVTSLGNFEHNFNILNLQSRYPWTVKEDSIVSAAQEKLLQARLKRRRPHLDNKILCSWNGLMISALCAGYRDLGDQHYLNAAIKCANFIKSNMYREGVLLRSHCQGEAQYNAFLEDYAYLIQGLLDLHQSSSELAWQNWALELQAKLDELFWDEQNHGYYYTQADAPGVLIRKKDFTDGAIPSGNGVSCLNLLRLHQLTKDKKHLERAEKLIGAMSGLIDQFPAAAASVLLAAEFLADINNN